MEVIKHGNTYREAECPGCGALLSYYKADVKYEKTEYYYLGWNCTEKEYIRCPECKETILFKLVVNGEEQEI